MSMRQTIAHLTIWRGVWLHLYRDVSTVPARRFLAIEFDRSGDTIVICRSRLV